MSLSAQNTILLFMRRIDCACRQIHKRERHIQSDNNHFRFDLKAIRNVYGYWRVQDKIEIQPIYFLLDGHPVRNGSPFSQINSHYNIDTAGGNYTILNSFLHGFTSNTSMYRDIWLEEAYHTLKNDPSYSESVRLHSAVFNMGRALLSKYCNIHAPFVIPSFLKSHFKGIY